MRHLLAALGLVLWAPAARAQEFVPPDQRPGAARPAAEAPARAAATGGVRAGIFGFSTRAGGQVNEDTQVVLGSTVDVVELGTPRLRLRPSFEVGFGRPAKSLGFNVEAVYRFQGDDAPAIPYLGLGIGYYDDGGVERGWATFALGFELPFRRGMSWLFEYHSLDGVGRSRVLVGLATRAGGN